LPFEEKLVHFLLKSRKKFLLTLLFYAHNLKKLTVVEVRRVLGAKIGPKT